MGKTPPDTGRKKAQQGTDFRPDKIELTEAINLIRHAGYPDPRSEAEGGALIQRVIDTLCTLSMHDGLTGLANARFFRMALKREVHRAARQGESCTLMMFDVDHFKAINDRYGHLVGDIVLATIARRLQEGLRPVDTIARYGGEEFAAILPSCPIRYARQVAERLRTAISDTPVAVPGKAAVPVTLSIGIACMPPGAPPDPERLLEVADKHLYAAKTHGRNQVWSDALMTTEVSPAERAALFKKKKKG